MVFILLAVSTYLCPLQEADPHFQSYRIMMIGSCTCELDSLVSEVEDPILRYRMHSLVDAIKFNLGEGNIYQ